MDFDTIDIIILLPIFYFNIGDFYTKKNNGTRATLFARIIKMKRRFYHPRENIYEETSRIKNIGTQLPSRSVLIASRLRTKCSKTSYTVCVYTHSARRNSTKRTFARRRVTREFVYYDEFINPVLKIYYYIYIYSERKFESIFISIARATFALA